MPGTRPTLALDGELLLADLDELGQIGVDPAGGLTRIAYSPADIQARDWLAARMRALGMAARIDSAGNLVGRIEGAEPLGAIAIGSHADTVAQGGRYDGALGVLAGLACARAVRAAGIQLRHPLEVIAFAAEEATLVGTVGSRAMAGELSPQDMAKPAYDGRTVADHLRGAGLDPAAVGAARRRPGEIAAYLELHIEQGGTLEARGLPVGLVEGIVGIRRFAATFQGQANHAGTTEMGRRRDALVAAAQFVLAVRDVAEAAGIVGTVGTIGISPNVPNVIPGRAELSFEVRALDDATLARAEAELVARAEALGGSVAALSRKEPVRSDERLLGALAAACGRLGLAALRMPSGAGHDAMSIASIAPQAMLFVPSRGGVSHAPDEETAPEECVAGARVLLEALAELDATLDERAESVRLELFLDSSGYPRARSGYAALDGFLEQDVQSNASWCRELIAIVDDVAGGRLAAWEGTGNAHTLSLSGGGAHIECEFAIPPSSCSLSLEDLKDALVGWLELVR